LFLAFASLALAPDTDVIDREAHPADQVREELARRLGPPEQQDGCQRRARRPPRRGTLDPCRRAAMSLVQRLPAGRTVVGSRD
jgi:hypothetical protein